MKKFLKYEKWNDIEVDAVFNAILSRVPKKDADVLRTKITDRNTKIMYLVFCDETLSKKD